MTQQQLEERMGAVLAETQKLRDVADDFERDMIEEKMAEMKAKDAEIQTLQERVTELEDENEGGCWWWALPQANWRRGVVVVLAHVVLARC